MNISIGSIWNKLIVENTANICWNSFKAYLEKYCSKKFIFDIILDIISYFFNLIFKEIKETFEESIILTTCSIIFMMTLLFRIIMGFFSYFKYLHEKYKQRKDIFFGFFKKSEFKRKSSEEMIEKLILIQRFIDEEEKKELHNKNEIEKLTIEKRIQLIELVNKYSLYPNNKIKCLWAGNLNLTLRQINNFLTYERKKQKKTVE